MNQHQRMTRYLIDDDRGYGYIDRDGHVVIPPQYSMAEPFCEGYALVKHQGKYGFIAEDGRWLVEPRFDGALSFQDGLAAVAIRSPGACDRLWGYIDRSGTMVIQPQYIWGQPFNEGVAVLRVQRGLFRCIDHANRVVFSIEAAHVDGFRQGRASFQPLDSRFQGCLDITGTVRIDPQYGLVEPFFEDRAAVVDEETWLRGCIDRAGRLVVEPKYLLIGHFHEGLAPVFVVNDDPGACDLPTVGYIDRNGAVVIPIRYQDGGCFSEGLAVVEVLTNEGLRSGCINRAGAWVIEPQFRKMAGFVGGLCHVETRDHRSAYIDRSGHIVWGPS